MWVVGQQTNNLRQATVGILPDTVTIDTLSIVPGTVTVFQQNVLVDTTTYMVNYADGKLIWRKNSNAYKALSITNVRVVYRVFPVLFTKTYSHKQVGNIYNSTGSLVYAPEEKNNDFFKMESLNHSGSISRGITFGNNQDVVVNSGLNLQMAGRIDKSWEISAAITDNNIPLQPDGNTQQLQDFDKVFIQLSNERTKIIAGDFELARPQTHFLNFFKRAQGGLIQTTVPFENKKHVLNISGSASISRGKFARNVVIGIEANQGPYRLQGADNEVFIIVLSGTERVYIDGVLMMRGQEHDYIIDYNTAEIKFTANRIITKDKRITVEFQYSDKNYVRSLVYGHADAVINKGRYRLDVYNEQDAKNQPLLQDLSNADKTLLASVGDSVNQAYKVNADSIAFTNNEVLYKRIDTLFAGTLYQSIYVHSVNADSAFYRVGFSFLGSMRGNYIQQVSPVNGKVFQWVTPVNGVPQGQYEPITLLIAPQKKQMITAGADYQLTANTGITTELAFSNTDLNLFSQIHNADNQGFAINTKLNNKYALQKNKADSAWVLHTTLAVEHLHKNFRFIEPYRPIEFARDWNLATTNATGAETATTMLFAAMQKQQLISYQLKTFFKGSYNGLQHQLNMQTQMGKWHNKGYVTYLHSKANGANSGYIRAFSNQSYALKRVTVGVQYETENNKLFNAADTLTAQSFFYQQYDAYITNAAAANRFTYKISGGQRYDFAIDKAHFKYSNHADNMAADITLNGKTNGRFMAGFIYRQLHGADSIIQIAGSQTLLQKMGYTNQWLNGGINLNTYYEASTGQELRKEFSYLEVQPGTGVYTWNDYNLNGVKELNEFEVSAFTDQANYIRIFVPTTTYIRTISTQFNNVLGINPAAFLKLNKPAKKVLSKFAAQFALQFDNKRMRKNIEDGINPIVTNINDTNLVAANTLMRHTLFYNRISSVAGADYTFQNARNKIFLTNGYEIRTYQFHQVNMRWNITKVFGTTLLAESGIKKSGSDFFSNRSYHINYYRTEPGFSIQPNALFRTIFSYALINKTNTIGEPAQKMQQNRWSVEVKYSNIKRGLLSARFNYINISYNDDSNSPLAYEMLEGYQKGKNLQWIFNLQRNLSKVLQLTVNYEGRKSNGVPVVHTASVQARAFF
ncbi:MAG: hypothetical protein JNK61_11705 [Bacteroidia bacterium]|nr:hypothetical protein [Bacteroidia bacterium]